ncbi:arsenic efflux protein [Vibrio sp. SM6]|uniref:Arsenic efflux protein n=1 Tax=Vibrio agarilyticus TaxID=2726741 RepID=A0A7X8YFI8_9VIBR|nr:putative manganese transporter [Vibrio agarilyticus]NLS11963.1 arsenic efflux protein [Vibrio agarilyticus]
MSSSLSFSLPRWLGLSQFHLAYKRLLLPVVLIAFIVTERTREMTVNTLSDAFWAVSCYVAFTLAIYHYASLWMGRKHRLVALYDNSRHYQVLFAALLGALPGCGGAIIVTTQFVSGRVGFGAVVAVLTATMGDAAFLLLAAKPEVGLGVIVLGVVVGCLTGWLVNALHRDDFLRPQMTRWTSAHEKLSAVASNSVEKKALNLQGAFWKWLLIPATFVALLGSFQVDLNAAFSLPEMGIEWLGAIFMVLSMLLWAMTKDINDYESAVSEDNKLRASHPLQKAAQDTNFVSAWVVVAFMGFELVTYFSGADLGSWLGNWGVYMPQMGLMVGLLPGCGPQILVTSLYLSGAVPMSAQLANAISNDGDALFPAIAMAPKAALVATFYSAIPAFIVGYGYYFLVESSVF